MSGELLTPKLIRTVGSLIAMEGSGAGVSIDAMVSPIEDARLCP